jgi:dCTP deaminase
LKANVSRGLWLTVDLLGVTAGPIGWRARNNAPVVDFDLVDHYEPSEFWEALGPDVNGRLILNPGDFYILSSRERVRVPPAYAAEMVPYDPAMGEFRAHYAGFFDPGFGYGEGKLEGTRAVLEVRSYDVPYLLRDGQNIARLVYEQLREAPEKLYGVDVPSSYQNQFMGLGKQFRRG